MPGRVHESGRSRDRRRARGLDRRAAARVVGPIRHDRAPASGVAPDARRVAARQHAEAAAISRTALIVRTRRRSIPTPAIARNGLARRGRRHLPTPASMCHEKRSTASLRDRRGGALAARVIDATIQRSRTRRFSAPRQRSHRWTGTRSNFARDTCWIVRAQAGVHRTPRHATLERTRLSHACDRRRMGTRRLAGWTNARARRLKATATAGHGRCRCRRGDGSAR